MQEFQEELNLKLQQYRRDLPAYPDGRIDYSQSLSAPILALFVHHNDKLLILKRSDDVRMYKEKWHVVTSYIDSEALLYELTFQELAKSLNTTTETVKHVEIHPVRSIYDDLLGTHWDFFPVVVELHNKPKIEPNWEHTDHRWVKHAQLSDFETVTGITQVYDSIRPTTPPEYGLLV